MSEDGLSEAELDAIAERVARRLDDDAADPPPVDDETDTAELPPDPTVEAVRERAREDAAAAAEAARRDLAATEAAVEDAGDDLERTVAASLADVERQVAADLAALDPLGTDPLGADDGTAFEARLEDDGRVAVPESVRAALGLSPGDELRVVVDRPDG